MREQTAQRRHRLRGLDGSWRYYLRELAISLLMGGMPVMISLFLGGVDEMTRIIQSLLAPNVVTYYFSALAILHLLIALLNRRFVFARSLRPWINHVESVFTDVGTGLLGVFRTAAGMLITFSAIWLVFEPSARELGSRAPGLLIFGFFTVMVCCWLYGLNREVRSPRSSE